MAERGSKNISMNYQFSNPGHKEGFSLVEVMIAMVILLVGMLGVIGMQYYAVTGNSFSREMRVATNLAHQFTEQMKATSYVNIVPDADVITDPIRTGGVSFTRRLWVFPDCFALSLDKGGNGDDGTCDIGLVPGCPGGDPDVAVAVASSAIRSRTCWTDTNGDDHSVTLDTVRWNENVVP